MRTGRHQPDGDSNRPARLQSCRQTFPHCRGRNVLSVRTRSIGYGKALNSLITPYSKSGETRQHSTVPIRKLSPLAREFGLICSEFPPFVAFETSPGFSDVISLRAGIYKKSGVLTKLRGNFSGFYVAEREATDRVYGFSERWNWGI